MVNITFAFGLAGSITAATIFLPQVWKAWKTKRTGDLSWLTVIIGILNGTFWIVYGIFKLDPFIYVTNSLLFTATVILAILKKLYDRNKVV